MTDFVRLTETNDHEGERWNWWLQVDGNEEQLDLLKSLLWEAEGELDGYDEFPYDFCEADVEPEAVVDKLIEYADENYYLSHNKVPGTFTCPPDLGENAERLYKGGIIYYFKETKR